MTGEALALRLWSDGPKRVLALFGDGGRALTTVGLLAELERRLARRSGRRSFRLAHYFDLIGGSSTAAAVAAMLAMGRRVAEAGEFLRLTLTEPDAKAKSSAALASLDAALDRAFGDARLDGALPTGLLIPVKPVDGPLRLLLNAPPRAGEDAPPAPRLADAIKATLGAAPGGEPRTLTLGATPERFVDAALFGAADPSMLLLQAASLPPFGLGWPTGPDQILMISVGCGAHAGVEAPTPAQALVLESRRQTLTTIQALGASPAPWLLDGAPEGLPDAQLSPVPMLRFLRMDVRLEQPALAALGLDLDEASVARMRVGARDPLTLARLHEAGVRAGQAQLGQSPGEREALPARFDPRAFQARPRAGPPRIRLQALGRAFERRDPDDD